MNAHLRGQALVDPRRVFQRPRMLRYKWIERKLYPKAITCRRLQTLKCLATHRLIANSQRCGACNAAMTYRANARCQDRYIWHCPLCGTSRSMRLGSFFQRSRLRLWQLLLLIYKWCDNHMEKSIMRKTEIRSWSTMVDWANLCRDVCSAWLANNPVEIGGMDANGIQLKWRLTRLSTSIENITGD
jgi:hypothetical protein